MLLDRHFGSWFFRAALLSTSHSIRMPEPTDHCGTCTACLDACPTNPFPRP
ncbi:MAG: hypothetical protein CM1200mP2_21820 [Planctomycetaceae bacterium]|nr:MAG: hypothetical protein CM1200mP2_21820 [Planctomycetaceae bacterium]